MFGFVAVSAKSLRFGGKGGHYSAGRAVIYGLPGNYFAGPYLGPGPVA